MWREFDDGEEWFAGRVLWLWARSWKEPRLAIANRADGCEGEWIYEHGKEIGSSGEELPTHCSDPVLPPPPTS